MIELSGRDARHTMAAMDKVIAVAAERGMLPHHFHIGFFNLRDLLDIHTPGWRSTGWPAALRAQGRMFRFVPIVVSSFDDLIELSVCPAQGLPPIGSIRWIPE